MQRLRYCGLARMQGHAVNADIGITVLYKENTTGTNSEGKSKRTRQIVVAALPDKNRSKLKLN